MPLPGPGGPATRRFQTCRTLQEVFAQHRGAYPGLTYHRIPLPDFCAPCEQVRGLCGLGPWGVRAGPLPPLLWPGPCLWAQIPPGTECLFHEPPVAHSLLSKVQVRGCVCMSVFILCLRCVCGGSVPTLSVANVRLWGKRVWSVCGCPVERVHVCGGWVGLESDGHLVFPGGYVAGFSGELCGVVCV